MAYFNKIVEPPFLKFTGLSGLVSWSKIFSENNDRFSGKRFMRARNKASSTDAHHYGSTKRRFIERLHHLVRPTLY